MAVKERKAYIVLAIAGILAFGFGIWKITDNIKSPFRLKPMDKNNTTVFEDQTKDTDGDGLKDIEETSVYMTSPYLEDTDSDGLSDGDEIKNNTDPNCPSGKVCTIEEEKVDSSGAIDILDSIPGTGTTDVSTILPDASSDIDMGSLENLTANDIRNLLKQGGMKEEDLKKLDDKTLMEIYKEALEQQK